MPPPPPPPPPSPTPKKNTVVNYLYDFMKCSAVFDKPPPNSRYNFSNATWLDFDDTDISSSIHTEWFTFQVYPIDTRDSSGRLTFHPDHPYKIFAKLGDNARVYTYRLRNGYHGNPRVSGTGLVI